MSIKVGDYVKVTPQGKEAIGWKTGRRATFGRVIEITMGIRFPFTTEGLDGDGWVYSKDEIEIVSKKEVALYKLRA